MAAGGRAVDGPIVHGHCEPRFARVRDALEEVLASGFEVGAALAVCIDTHAVIDLWGGHADAARTRPWQRDTIVNLFSVGKAVTAVCALRLADAGRLDLDAPVGPGASQPPAQPDVGDAGRVVRVEMGEEERADLAQGYAERLSNGLRKAGLPP